MTSETVPFIDYWNAIERELLKRFAIDITDAGIEAETIADAQQDGWTPEQFALWYGEKYDLTPVKPDDKAAETAALIAQQNDAFRSRTGMPVFGTPEISGSVVLTRGIRDLPPVTQISIMAEVRDFADFSADNDPYGEHDFGAFTIEGAGKIFWKIDYCDTTMTKGSEDPSDPQQTVRVLTIMLAGEY